MASYARNLSVIGFLLMVWTAYRLLWGLWTTWNFQRLHDFGHFPDWLGTSISLWVILLLGVASVLLRRLARPHPTRNIERLVARFWVIPNLCYAGFAFWAFWALFTNSHYHMAIAQGPYYNAVRLLVPLLVGFAIVAFVLGSLQPLWVLSK